LATPAAPSRSPACRRSLGRPRASARTTRDLLTADELLENVTARRGWCERTLEVFRGIDDMRVTGWGPRESPTEALHYGLELIEWMRDWYARKERELRARARRDRRAGTPARRRR